MVERWLLMSESTFDAVRFGVGVPDLLADAPCTTPDTIENDEHVHDHLNEGGIVIITCETE